MKKAISFFFLLTAIIVFGQTKTPETFGFRHIVYKYKNSYPPSIKHLEKLKIPVLVTFGTKDAVAPFNDFLQVEAIRQGKRNFTFKAYVGTDHIFFH